MILKIPKKDLKILTLLQKNCKTSARQIADQTGSPISTIFSKIRRMEKSGVIKEYKAILNSKMLQRGTTAFILASVSYGIKGNENMISQRDTAQKISKFPEVQEVHIITGDWDLLIKLKAKNVDTVGKFVIDKLRSIEGIEKTLTCMVFETCKETTEINLEKEKRLFV
ncbi:MAG: Lrp/AsnC family transcriptional regulator [Candidatus Bathyarchaeota archaeon]|jgi:DNA-binding Lrp family transcriptional regulator